MTTFLQTAFGRRVLLVVVSVVALMLLAPYFGVRLSESPSVTPTKPVRSQPRSKTVNTRPSKKKSAPTDNDSLSEIEDLLK